MPDRFCVLCGSSTHVVYVAGVNANLCAQCRSVVYAHSMLEQEDEKPLQDKEK